MLRCRAGGEAGIRAGPTHSRSGASDGRIFEARGGAGHRGWGREWLRARGSQPPSPGPSADSQLMLEGAQKRQSAGRCRDDQTRLGWYTQGRGLLTGPFALCRKPMGCATKAAARGLRAGGQGQRPQSNSALNIVWPGQVTSLTWLLSSVEKVTRYLPSSLLQE